MNKMIECKNVVFKYSTGEEIEKLAIDGLNLEVNEGEFLVVLGHNGSGKSTVAKHMNALLVPTEGTVIVNGLDTSDENNVWDIRATAGMVFQNPDNQLVATIVEEDVAFGPENLGVPPEEIRKRVYDALEKVGMSEYKKHAPHLLSGGQKQRVAIAGILAIQPKCIIFDEPTAMLDPSGRREVMENIKELNKKNIHLSLWNYPYLQEDSPAFKELAERGFFIKNKEGHPAMFKATADSEFLCACFDFTNPEFLAWYEERVKKIVRMGVSVIKTDFSEAVPEDVVFYNGMSGREGHNLLTYLYAKNIYTWMKEICDERGELPMLWGRSGYVGSHTIPAAWAGDSSSDKASHSAILQAGLGMAMSGVSFWGYDLGGFYNTGYIGNEERPNIEDYLSSVQMGLWMPLSRAHGKTPREPWQYGDMALKEVKKWINFRHRLVPYLYHTACQSHQSGIPMIRPLVMEYPKDPIAKTQNLSYMLGDALLISPGFDRDEYELYLPEGRWQDIESKEVYEGMTFVHIENKAFADGGTSLRVFQKEGTSIPLFAQKEVLHVPAQLWKQEDLEFMTFQKKRC